MSKPYSHEAAGPSARACLGRNRGTQVSPLLADFWPLRKEPQFIPSATEAPTAAAVGASVFPGVRIGHDAKTRS